MTKAPESARACMIGWLSNVPDLHQYERQCEPTWEQWNEIDVWAKEHRLRPMLHWVATRQGMAALPADLAAAWARAWKRTGLRWLQCQAAMAEASLALEAAGVAHLFLKGSTLVLKIYPSPALRPMRDLDLLVQPGDVEQARGVLEAIGYQSLPGAVTTMFHTSHQTPPLRDAKSGLTIDLHHDLIASEDYSSRPLLNFLWADAERAEVAGRSVPVCSTRGVALHILLHAGVKSRFSCGPLVLPDLLFVLEKMNGGIDELWEDAERLGLGRTLSLLLQVMERRGASFAARSKWLAPCYAVENDMLDHVEMLLVQPLQKLRQRRAVERFQRNGSSLGALGRYAARVVRPTARGIREATASSSHAQWPWKHYPRWVFIRARQFVTGVADKELASSIAQDRILFDWLGRDRVHEETLRGSGNTPSARTDYRIDKN